MKVRQKIQKADKYLLLGFVISMTNRYAWMAMATLLILAIFKNDVVTVIKGLLLFIIRVAAFNSVLVASLGSFSIFRYVFIIIYSVGIIYITKNVQPNREISVLRIMLTIFFLYSVNGSYPMVSITKTLMYVISFYAVLKGVFCTRDSFDWENYIYKMLYIIMLLSLFAIPFTTLRTKNGHAFQGILNHPNVFGIVAAVFVAFVVINYRDSRERNTITIIAVLFMQYLSESRTGLFSSVFILVVYILVSFKKRISRRTFTFFFILLFAVLILFFIPDISDKMFDMMHKFIFKGNNENLLYSKRRMFSQFDTKFGDHPFLGTGFMSLYIPGIRSFAMEFDQYVETVNVFMAVLGEMGIIGFVYWVCLYGYIYFKGDKKNVHLFIVPFIISSGEMVFFSANSVGFLLFFCFAVYLFPPKEGQEDLTISELKGYRSNLKS